MIVLNILLLLSVIGILAWLVFTLAIYALPLFVGVATGVWAHDTGAGAIGGFAIGAIVAGIVFITGQLVFAFSRPLWMRVAVALLFAGPAAVAGYAATLGVARLLMPSEGWQMAFSIIGGVMVGVVAVYRMAGAAPPEGSEYEFVGRA